MSRQLPMPAVLICRFWESGQMDILVSMNPDQAGFPKHGLHPWKTLPVLSNAGDFESVTQVPRLSVTMGISTILKSRKIILMAWGSSKAPAVQKSLEGTHRRNAGIPAAAA